MGAIHEWMSRAGAVRERRGLVRRTHAHPPGLLDLASNDYLDLSRDDRVIDAAVEATRRHGAGARASRVVAGTFTVHDELEAALCVLTGQEAALACSTGYAANLATLTALGGPDTLIVLDEHVHASLIDAARLSGAAVATVPHRDLDALHETLARRVKRRAIVAVESLYSVLGDTTDLRATADVCTSHDALLVVDEAHGIGVLGAGRGGVHAARLAGRDDVVVTLTFSKALGSMGGAVLGAPQVREHLVNTARPFVFDTGLAPGPAAAATCAASIVAREPARIAHLHRAVERLSVAAAVPAPPGPILSVPMASAREAALVADRLLEAGVLVGCFRPPSVPDGVSRLRLSARPSTSTADLDRFEDLLSGLRRVAGGTTGNTAGSTAGSAAG